GYPRVTVTPPAAPPRPEFRYRVYGRRPGDSRLLVTLPAGSGAAWVDDGTAAPQNVVAPTYATAAAAGTGRAAAEVDTFQFPFRSRHLAVTAFDAGAVVQLDPGSGQWEPELAVDAGRRTELRMGADRLRIRTADLSGGIQTRYRVEVFD